MKEIIALQEYTDKYISLYEGEIRNIENGIAQKLIEEGVVAEHNDNEGSSDNENKKAFNIIELFWDSNQLKYKTTLDIDTARQYHQDYLNGKPCYFLRIDASQQPYMIPVQVFFYAKPISTVEQFNISGCFIFGIDSEGNIMTIESISLSYSSDSDSEMQVLIRSTDALIQQP